MQAGYDGDCGNAGGLDNIAQRSIDYTPQPETLNKGI